MNKKPTLRVGIDFGYAYTGLALLNDENRVLVTKVIWYAFNLSTTLKNRRANRAMRRRNQSRRYRLRDFYKLLREMGCPPAQITDNNNNAKKHPPANQLYTLVHRRGWDYAELADLLMETDQNDRPYRSQLVKEIDNMLVCEGAPATPPAEEPKKPHAKENSDQFALRRESYRRAMKNFNAGKPPEEEDARWMKIEQTCLGYLADAALGAYELTEQVEQGELVEGELQQADERLDDLTEEIDNIGDAKESDATIRAWLGGRLDAAFGGNPPPAGEKRDRLINNIMARLGLCDTTELFEGGEIHRRMRSRHRNIMLNELEEAFNDVAETPEVKARAAEIAATRGCDQAPVIEQWRNRAKTIVNRPYRQKRFQNRKIGKCPVPIKKPAKSGERDERCGKNVPRRARPDIRKILFEVEARLMNINEDNATRKLNDDEIRALFACVSKWDQDGGKINEVQWENFFKAHKIMFTIEDGEKLRNKKDVLHDLVCKKQAGRANWCAHHLKRRLALARARHKGEEWKHAWSRLHDGRILDESDAPPSLRWKIDIVCFAVLQMLRAKLGRDPVPADFAHIGIESARFDIHALSAQEGRKLKKKASYSKPRGSSLPNLIKKQNGLCLYCGNTLGANDTKDHVFPRARGGGNVYLNCVAACWACNIDKWKFTEDVAIDPQALDALREKDAGKARYIENLIKRGERPVSTGAAVQTMFGAKILRGALVNALAGNFGKSHTKRKKNEACEERKKQAEAILRDKFAKIRGTDSALLREWWFPLMNRQKKALRAAARQQNKVQIAYIGERFELSEKALEEKIGSISIINATAARCEGKPALKLSVKNGALSFTPNDDDLGLAWISLRGECKRTFTYQEGRDLYRLSNWTESVEVLKEDGVSASVKERNDRGRMYLEMQPLEGEFSKREARVKTDAIDVPIIICPRRKSKKQGRSGDPIRDFHHALDAVILAAKVDWKTIQRLARDPQTRTADDQWRLKRAAEAGRPDVSGIAVKFNGDYRAPPPGDWLVIKHRDATGAKAAKTKREPVRYRPRGMVPLDRLPENWLDDVVGRDGENAALYRALKAAWQAAKEEKIFHQAGKKFLQKDWLLRRDTIFADARNPAKVRAVEVKGFQASQRIPLDRLPRSAIERIDRRDEGWNKKIYDALCAAWKTLDDMEKTPRSELVRKKGKEEYLTAKWFLRFPEDILRPYSPQEQGSKRYGARSVRVIEPDASQSPLFAVRRGSARHYFGRTEQWGEAVLYRSGKKVSHATRRPAWYVNAENPEEWGDGGAPPDDAKIIARFRKGDTVTVDAAKKKDLPGLWRVKEIGQKMAALEPKDNDAFAVANKNTAYLERGKISVSYRALQKITKSSSRA